MHCLFLVIYIWLSKSINTVSFCVMHNKSFEYSHEHWPSRVIKFFTFPEKKIWKCSSHDRRGILIQFPCACWSPVVSPRCTQPQLSRPVMWCSHSDHDLKWCCMGAVKFGLLCWGTIAVRSYDKGVLKINANDHITCHVIVLAFFFFFLVLSFKETVRTNSGARINRLTQGPQMSSCKHFMKFN